MEAPHSSYVVPTDRRSKLIEAPNNAMPDLPDLSIIQPVPPSKLFAPSIAKANRFILGMKLLGSEKRGDGADRFRYIGQHAIGATCLATANAPVFYCLGLGWLESWLCAVIMFVPMMILSAIREPAIFEAPLLGQRLTRLLHQDDRDLKGLSSVFAFVGDFAGLLVIFSLVNVPLQVLLVLPTAKALKDDAGLQLASNAMVVAIVAFYTWLLSTGYPFQAWASLVGHFIKEVTDCARFATDEMLRVLNDDKLTPAEARDRLGTLHDRVLLPLRNNIRKRLNPWLNAVLLGILFSWVPIIILFIGNIDEKRSTLVFGVVGSSIARYAFCAVSGIGMPMYVRSLLTSLAGPWKVWHALEEQLDHAGRYGRAIEKFDGSGHNLKFWMDRNRIEILLFGVPVDNNLGGKISGLLGSLGSALVFYVLRSNF